MRAQVLAGFAALAPMPLTACATLDTVVDAPITAGAARDYQAPYDIVKAAALQAVERLNVDIQGADETPERFQIRFTKAIDAFSWGEVGVVNVVRVDESSARVYVNTEKRSMAQITGTSEQDFARQIFANIDQALARLQP